jgi:alkaline phosphatase
LLAEDAMPKMQENRGNYSPRSTQKALNILSKNPQGFFLMIEGSQIDWGGHNNDAEYIKQEMLDFDNVIGEVLEFAKKDKNTLVIVAADHETGGFALTGDGENKDEKYGLISPKFTSKGHSATMVPVFAYGIGAEEFSGVYDNTEIFFKLKKLLKF